jgi:hypothetical protein
VSESGSITTPSISGVPSKGLNISITVTVNVAGRVRFLIDGKRIANCISRTTSGTYPNFTSTCTWKPTRTGRQFITAILTPSNSNFTSVTSQPQMIWVVARSTKR